MKNKTFVPGIASLAVLAAVPAAATADVTANIGWASQYVYRGVFQETSSASAGLDYETSGFYAGVWGADVGQGIETDLYLGYGGEAGDFSWSVGATGYFYTDDFDDTYKEINLGIGYGLFSLDVAVGEWDGFGQKEDYTFTSFTIAPEVGPYFTVGSYGRDADGDYVEIGYSHDFMGVDLSVALIWSDDLQVGRSTTGEYTLVFGVNKTFALGRQ